MADKQKNVTERLTTDKILALAKDAKPGKSKPTISRDLPVNDAPAPEMSPVMPVTRAKIYAAGCIAGLIVAIQLGTFYMLWHKQPAPISQHAEAASAPLWQVWEKMAEEAVTSGTPEQAVFFYEKLLAELPHSTRKAELQHKLTTLYGLLQQRQKERDPVYAASLLQQDVPMIYFMAEQAYQRGNYSEARRQFCEFLLQADLNEEHGKLFAQAHFRLRQCTFQLYGEQRKWKQQQDIVVSHAIELTKQ